jgi:hypothetical protein
LKLFAPERVLLRDVVPRAPRRPPPYPASTRTPRTACDYQSEAGHRGHYAPKAGDARSRPRSVPRGFPTLVGVRTASLHWPPAATRRPPHPRPFHRHCGKRRLGETALEHCWPIKTLPCLSSHAHKQHCSPLPPAITAASELPSPLAPVTTQQPQARP